LTTGSPLSAELRGRITEAIGELPEKQRLALILYGVEGLPQKEVAQIMECSLELVKWNVFAARKTLRKSLAAYLE
jgi:RNA polymerase sigma-70 factor (ECF subfamily)